VWLAACGETPPVAPHAEPLAVPSLTHGRTHERHEHGIGAWFGTVESPLVVTLDAIRLRGTTIVPLADGELRPTDVDRGKIPALAATSVPRADVTGASVAIDPRVPYSTTFAVLETLRASGHQGVEIQARRDGRPVGLAVWLPTSAGPWEAEETLELIVRLTERGLLLSGSGGSLASGCEGLATNEPPPPTLVRRSGTIDLDTYQQCLARVKDRFPEETVLRLTARPDARFGEVAALWAASTALGATELFPDVVPAAPTASTPQTAPEAASAEP
jgi:hypothetical protein